MLQRTPKEITGLIAISLKRRILKESDNFQSKRINSCEDNWFNNNNVIADTVLEDWTSRVKIEKRSNNEQSGQPSTQKSNWNNKNIISNTVQGDWALKVKKEKWIVLNNSRKKIQKQIIEEENIRNNDINTTETTKGLWTSKVKKERRWYGDLESNITINMKSIESLNMDDLDDNDDILELDLNC
ncbi:hypothetical protein K502DRAFT_348220 [Neoconidiobolus thromboides FSU 785]|nr:hypothetical protein K502DRAFT_348220 [Neoconidiobolus thromboides FSU 785]